MNCFKMKNKNGLLSFEMIIFLSFVVLLVVTVLTFVKLSSKEPSANDNNKSPIESYSRILTSVRDDAMFSSKVEVNDSGFILYDAKNNKVVYKIVDSSFYRIGPENKKTVLMNGIEKAKFKKSSELPSLFSVYIYPKEKMFIPFFTSFALRSGVSEGEK